MASSNGYQQSIMWDDVHILTVNHHQQALYLSQNVGGSPGELHIRESDVVIRADMRDPLKVLDMAIRYVIRYDLLARVLDAAVVSVFEQMGVKAFLDQLLSLTTEEIRRDRFNGLSFFEYTVNPKPVNATADEEPDEDELDDEEEVEEAEPTTVAAAIKTRRKRNSSS